MLKLTGSTSKLARLPLPADEPKQPRPDITRAGNTLGWQPKLKDGLKETIRYFRSITNHLERRQG